MQLNFSEDAGLARGLRERGGNGRRGRQQLEVGMVGGGLGLGGEGAELLLSWSWDIFRGQGAIRMHLPT